MSSFTIAKREYVKAAGIITGIASVKRDRFFVFDYQAGRKMQGMDFYNKFVECFEMNAISVAEQYHDDTPETNANDYMTEYNEAVNYGKHVAMYNTDWAELLLDLRQFFECAIYQTENEAYSWKMKMIFFPILIELMKWLRPNYESECWGTLDLDAMKNREV